MPRLLAGGKSPGRKKGAALVMVLLLITILAVIMSEFLYNLRINTTISDNYEEKVQARYVAKAGQNAADGLLAHTQPFDRMFNNEEIQLFKYECLTTELTTLGLTSEQEEEQEETMKDFEEMQNCGVWSLTIPYVLDETPIDLQIMDEQARINVNGMIDVVSGSTEETYIKMDRDVYNMLFELFRYQAIRNDILISDDDIRYMLEDLWDYMDYGMVDGTFDKDRLSYFEYEDKIISMKNGPLDSVEELRYLPEMNDKLFNAVKDFLTVYPTDVTLHKFEDRIDIDHCPVEVCYAMVRAASYEGEEPLVGEEKAWELCRDTIAANFYGRDPAADGKPTGDDQQQQQQQQQQDAASLMPRHNRKLPPEMLQLTDKFSSFVLKDNTQPRFYRIRSTALTDNGFETVIVRVVRVNFDKSITTLYYREK
ncbi:MAG: type II secretion system protein GspK [bacterium]